MKKRTLRRSASQWSAIIAEFDQSGQKPKGYCEEHGYNPMTFNKWWYRFSKAKSSIKRSAAGGGLVELVPANSAAPGMTRSMLIELDLGSGIQLRITR